MVKNVRAIVILLSLFSVSPAFAWSSTSCPAGAYDILAWMAPAPFTTGSGWKSSLNHQNTVPASAQSFWTTITNLGNAPGNIFHVKAAVGWPWDVLSYDANFIYYHSTGLSFQDPKSVAIFTPDVKWIKRCAKPGDSIRVNNAPTRTTVGNGSCALQPVYNDTIDVSLWGPYNFAPGSMYTPGNVPTLVIGYLYGYNGTKFTRKEEMVYQEAKGLIGWRYFELQGSTFVMINQTILGATAPGSTPAYVNQCGL